MVKFSTDLWDGFDHLSAKTELGLTVLKDVTDFIKKRAAIEAEYGKKLQDLCKSVPGSGVFTKNAPIEKELKTLKGALLSWQEEGSKIAAHHIEFSNKINTDVVKPLEAFIKAKEPERKKTIAEGQKRVTAYQNAKANLEKAKKDYLSAMKDAETATEAHEKAKADLEAGPEAKKKQLGENEKRLGQRATQLNDKAKAAETAYQKAVDTANDVSKETFGTHLPPVIDALQTLEEERYAQAKTVLEAFHKEFRSLPDSLIERAEELSKALEALDAEADLQEYTDEKKSEKSEPEVFKFQPYKEPAPSAEKEEPKKEEEDKEAKSNADL
jgi:hypothetical protein